MIEHGFTVRPRPFAGESFWSYILRVSSHNGIPILTVLNNIRRWEKRYVQKTDFDLFDLSPESVVNMEQLSALTGRTVQELLGTTFYPVLLRFGTSEETQRARFMSGMLMDTYRYCPICLAETLYYRLLWRMTPVTVCTKHGTVLIDKCPQCEMSIRFRDIELLNVCPYCGGILTKSRTFGVSEGERRQQDWIHEALSALLVSGGSRIDPPELAMRLLYLLCDRQSHFDRKLAEVSLPSILPTLLQHARDSLSQKRTLHLTFLLNTLYEHHHSMIECLDTVVPDSFAESVRQGTVRKSDRLSCQAPWCDSYQQSGTLVKTGTTLKRRKSGETLLYYLACIECGCEYAINEGGDLQERTYFIEGYEALRNVDVPLTMIKSVARRTGFTEDKIRRCVAYFSTRLEPHEWSGSRFEVDVNLLHTVLDEIRQGTKLKVIQKWDCWDSCQQFLIYRFHSAVMRVLNELTRPRLSKRSDSSSKRATVRKATHDLLERDEDITIAAVCSLMKICPETIRSWGCNLEIAKAKQVQRHRRLESLKKSLYEKTDEYLEKNRYRIVLSDELHEYLGVGRTVLWRKSDDVALYISERLARHNANRSNI